MADFFGAVSESQHNSIQDSIGKILAGLQPTSDTVLGNLVGNGGMTLNGVVNLPGLNPSAMLPYIIALSL